MPTDEKPSRNEEEYFGKKNLEIIHEMRMKLDAERKSDGRKADDKRSPPAPSSPPVQSEDSRDNGD